MLIISRLSKFFGTRRVFDSADLHLESGDIVVLQGPSGSGKTTLLRLIAGLEAPESGKISIGGESMTDGSWLRPPWERGIAMAFQDDGLWSHLTVDENLALVARPGSPFSGVAERMRLATEFGIGHLLSRYPGRLSGGEAKRVAVARALAAHPRLLLLDEPLAHLDGESLRIIRESLCRHLSLPGRTTLVVSHTPLLESALGGRLLTLQNGKLIEGKGHLVTSQ